MKGVAAMNACPLRLQSCPSDDWLILYLNGKLSEIKSRARQEIETCFIQCKKKLKKRMEKLKLKLKGGY